MTTPAPELPSHETSAPAKCTNCSHDVVGVYCARCGEKQPGHHDLTLGHFLHELFHELAHVDSKVFSTLRDLLVRPGELTAAYFEGRKQRYVAPLRLFLTLFALQFLAYSAYKPVAIYSLEGLMTMDQTHQFENAMKRAAAKRHLTFAELTESVNHRWQKNMSLLSLGAIVGIALMLKLLYARRRRFLGQHLVFAAHFLCFTYVMSLAIWPVHLLTGIKQSTPNRLIMLLTVAISIYYVFVGLRRVYGQGAGKRLFKSVMVVAATFATTMVLLAGALLGAIVQVMGA
jgi:cation transport ATPase